MSDNTYDHGVSKMDAHNQSCEVNDVDRSWLIFTPPDDVIPSCPKCHDVIFGVTCMLDGDGEQVVHPCHHVLTWEESQSMVAAAVSF